MKRLMFIMIGMFLIASASATSIGTFKQNENVQLYQTCNNCTYCNLTRVSYPNSTNILTNINMTQDNSYFSYNIGAGNTTILGTWSYCYDCGNAVEKDTGCIEFDVNTTGVELTTAKAFIYLGLLALLIIIFVIDLFAVPMLPSGDLRDDDGRIISINKLKYLRPVLYGIAWFLLIGIIFIGSNIAFAYLGTNLLGSILFKIFQIMMLMSYPMLLLAFIGILYNIVQDKKMKKMMNRGFE